jgi:peptidoglycan/LPS O-acetylase OafA/YrhL
MAVVIILILAVIVTLFLFKKRMLQIRITAIILLAHIGFIAALFYVADTLAKKFAADAVYEAGAYIALIPLVFLVLANRAIRKDEKMVRSTDRLRD